MEKKGSGSQGAFDDFDQRLAMGSAESTVSGSGKAEKRACQDCECNRDRDRKDVCVAPSCLLQRFMAQEAEAI